LILVGVNLITDKGLEKGIHTLRHINNHKLTEKGLKYLMDTGTKINHKIFY
jgi:hypothetical protein